MSTTSAKNILIAPLDWGLGHTTRCIPIIQYIRRLGHNPIVAGNSSQISFVTEQIPGVATTLLEGYNVRYTPSNQFLQAGLLSQLPAITKTISREHQWVRQKADELQLHGIISDNRYGLYHPALPSVIITHQLRVMSGFGSMPDRMIQRLHYRMLNRFGATWVPDNNGQPNLAGELSHPTRLPYNTAYIGLLSRFAASADATTSGPGPLLILLSGPEPQRTVLAKTLWQQATQYNGPVVFVEGSEEATATNVPPHITYHKRLPGEALKAHMERAAMVICRSGYSTLMDLVAMGKRAIVIPTPGQTEQEYLGASLHQQGVFYCATQQGFDLQTALNAAVSFPFSSLPLQPAFSLYQQVIGDWLQKL